MRNMDKTAAGLRFDRGNGSQPVARAAAVTPGAATSGNSRPTGTLADRVKTFVDRTLDAARGRYDM